MRQFSPSYVHTSMAKLMHLAARKGFQTGETVASLDYVESCSWGINLAEYPKSVSLIFTRDNDPECKTGWHLSICCVTNKGYRGYQPDEGRYWVNVVFGAYAHLAVEQLLTERSPFGVDKDVRHFLLPCDWSNSSDPLTTLEGWCK